ncbi:hypothetical protein [Geodermatophilus chilensis]|uniref:hypothetical protein n=1 Tax=Geodermatophilus chilensis TaxID=2035835 RepID=UPI000C25F903|nr:hypothetical protein [Geodermatophilus chilensis]
MATAMLTPPTIDSLAAWRRPAAEVMTPERLGAARATRHSFTASLLRRAVRRGWRVAVERWAIDADGVGEAVYRVDAEGSTLRFVVLSTVIDERVRTDRVVASGWDVTAALVDGPLDPARLERIRAEVPRQEQGVADPDTLVWTRGNRSARFFDYVVESLAAGRQPSADLVGSSPYVLRSTAYYGNGRFGMATYEGVRTRRAVAAPYRAQMLAAWLFREFSCDLVEHMARCRSVGAVRLLPAWRSGLGIGNATGLGMVPYVISHPAVLDRWVGVRETALALARATGPARAVAGIPRLQAHLDRALGWCAARADRSCAPFQDAASLRAELARLRAHLDGARHGGGSPLDDVWRWGEDNLGLEAQEVLLGALTDLDDTFDEHVDDLLHVERFEHSADPTADVGSLRAALRSYDWVSDLMGADGSEHWFWYYARDNEEPRRGVRGRDAGADVEMPVDVARSVARLAAAVSGRPDGQPVGALLLEAPELRSVVARVQSCAGLPYPEVRDNLLAQDFLPLQLQRFQLAMYGACEYVPQSTDWVRVTLMNGTPPAAALRRMRRYDHDLFPSLPGAPA